ncbi:hypothetical protein COBT_002031, partial [Conglomerata obtusa]
MKKTHTFIVVLKLTICIQKTLGQPFNVKEFFFDLFKINDTADEKIKNSIEQNKYNQFIHFNYPENYILIDQICPIISQIFDDYAKISDLAHMSVLAFEYHENSAFGFSINGHNFLQIYCDLYNNAAYKPLYDEANRFFRIYYSHRNINKTDDLSAVKQFKNLRMLILENFVESIDDIMLLFKIQIKIMSEAEKHDCRRQVFVALKIKNDYELRKWKSLNKVQKIVSNSAGFRTKHAYYTIYSVMENNVPDIYAFNQCKLDFYTNMDNFIRYFRDTCKNFKSIKENQRSNRNVDKLLNPNKNNKLKANVINFPHSKDIIAENIWLIRNKATVDKFYIIFFVITTHKIVENFTYNQNNVTKSCVSAYIQDDKEVALIGRYSAIERSYKMFMDKKECTVYYLLSETDRMTFYSKVVNSLKSFLQISLKIHSHFIPLKSLIHLCEYIQQYNFKTKTIYYTHLDSIINYPNVVNLVNALKSEYASKIKITFLRANLKKCDKQTN